MSITQQNPIRQSMLPPFLPMEETRKFLFSCISFFFLLFLFFSSAQSQEQEVLLQLKSHWGNPSSLSSWSANATSSSHCSWSGITCANSSVTNITLRDDATIAGDVPPFVCNITSLSVLDLYNNSINSTFPDLSLCRSLTHLNLGQNYLEGPIPHDVGAIVSKRLVYLNLAANYFTGDVPKAISDLSALRELYLHNNLFDGSITPEIGSISTLENLTLAYNPFAPAPIPEELGSLENLKFLWMTNTSLTGEVPDSFGRLVALEQLDLAINGLTGTVPVGIWGLRNLTYLYLYKNKLTGGIPATIGATKLAEIDVSMNQLNGSIPEDFGELKNLKILFMYSNQLSGDIPVGIGNITTLYDIRLFGNNLTGNLPPDLGKYSKLYNLEVCQNQLTGELPQHLCDAQVLNSLIVFDNNLTGAVPESLGNCSSLVNIQLHNNRFRGQVPSRMWSLKDLNTVIMHDNELSGELPDELPWNFTRLEIGNNRFSGKIPTKGKNFKVFYGSSNDFSGVLPSNMNGVSNLQQLRLDGNRLSGTIPTSIGKLNQLTELNLSSNQLTGEIPATIGSMLVLTALDLSNNHLSGAIPDSIGNLKLNNLNLSSNSLTGDVPPQLQNAAYDDSFLSNHGLCSSGVIINLPSCSSHSKNSELPKGFLALFLTLGIVIFIAAVVYGSVAVRDFRRRRKAGNDTNKWKLTSFHVVDFTETSILGGITPMNLIGSGGSGQVYAISLGDRGGEIVAVKKLWNKKKHDANLEREFLAEVEILGSIRHLNVVKLLCCVSGPESKLLVYEYMENGSLDQWLHGKRRMASIGSGRQGGGGGGGLDWPTRVAIAVGAARGLCYMHHDCNLPIIHRDVKSSNILLDSEFNPKVADFGLARILANSGEPESVSALAGSFGYMAPECAYSKRVSEKVDVYSFGVVLLELTTGKQSTDGGAHGCLAEWAWKHFQDDGSVVDIVDRDIRNPMWMEGISMVMKLGLVCTGTLPTTRPIMKEVLQVLIKCSGDQGIGGKDGGSEVGPDHTSNVPLLKKDNVPLLKKDSRRKKPVEMMTKTVMGI